jgi:hypothetical protein
MGTVSYMSPEQSRGKISTRDPTFSLSVVLMNVDWSNALRSRNDERRHCGDSDPRAGTVGWKYAGGIATHRQKVAPEEHG